MEPETLSALHAIFTRVARRLNAQSLRSSLTETELFILAFVDNRGPLSVKELIEWERLSPTMVSRIIGRLRAAHLIKSTADPSDRRVMRIEVTEQGRKIHKKNLHQRAKALEAAFGRMQPANAAMLVAALPAIEELAQELRPRLPVDVYNDSEAQ